MTMTSQWLHGPTSRLPEADCDLDELRGLTETTTDLADYPHAEHVRENVPVYSFPAIREAMARVSAVGGPTERGRRALQAELARALRDGPGLVLLSGAFGGDVVDAAAAAFEGMVADLPAAGTRLGDQRLATDAAGRVGNALEELAAKAPDTFVDYYANDALALVSSAWLGPAYQVTSQVEVVDRGSAPESMVRDCPLGLVGREHASQYPAHVHQAAPLLSLLGAVAHGDVPAESGASYLPHSQKLRGGCGARRLPEFQELFEIRRVQLPLRKGDAVFLNPALFHAAGGGQSTDVRRMTNKLHVFASLLRPTECVDHRSVTSATYPALLRRVGEDGDEAGARNALAVAAAGYPSTTTREVEEAGAAAASQSQAELVWRAVLEGWPQDRLEKALEAHGSRRRARR